MATTTYTWSPTLGTIPLLNPITPAGNQTSPAIAASADGTAYFNAWTHPGASDSVQGHVVSSLGVPEGEFIVNSTTFDDQNDASVAALNNGRYVAAFTDYSGVNPDIRVRLFEADGTAVGNDFVVDIAGQSRPDTEPDIAVLAGGQFVVTWTQEVEILGLPDTNIKFAIYNADGSPTSITHSTVNVATSSASASSVAALAGGGFVVAWQADTGGDHYTVYFRRFDANGQPLDGTNSDGITIDSVGDNNIDIQVVGLPDGGFVVAYTDDGWGISGTEITAHVYNADGTARTGYKLVNAGSTTGGNQNHPTLTVLSNGYFAIAWNDGTVQHMAAFDANGSALMSEGLAGGVVEGEIAGLANGKVAHTHRSTSPDAGGDDSIRTNIFELARIITGDLTDDTIVGAGGDLWEQLIGLWGNDTLEGGAGRDFLDGGSGFDYASYSTAPTGVVASLASPGANTGDATGDSYVLIDGLIGSAFDDALTGNAGGNTLNGGAGADTMAGRGDDDTYLVDNAGDVVTEEASEGFDNVIASVSTTLSENVEQLELAAGAGHINATGNSGNNSILGNEGDNILTGTGGFDILDGKDGDDTAVFSLSSGQYALSRAGNTITVNGPDGTTTLSNIEHIQFANFTFHLNDGSDLFDALHYVIHNPDVFAAGVDPLQHFNVFGWHEGRDPNAWFDTSGYLAVNKDVAANGGNPLDHYHNNGWHEGRDPSANFDTTLYLINNLDVAAAGIDPLAHYMVWGQAEGRQAYAAVRQPVNGFDAQYYLFHNPDVAAAGVDPLSHFNVFGWQEGRDPNAYFDTSEYLAYYIDVAAAGINPLQHYQTFGWKEGRDASAHFDTAGYLAAYPDVAAAGMNPLDHFLTFGIYEGRQAVNDGVWG